MASSHVFVGHSRDIIHVSEDDRKRRMKKGGEMEFIHAGMADVDEMIRELFTQVPIQDALLVLEEHDLIAQIQIRIEEYLKLVFKNVLTSSRKKAEAIIYQTMNSIVFFSKQRLKKAAILLLEPRVSEKEETPTCPRSILPQNKKGCSPSLLLPRDATNTLRAIHEHGKPYVNIETQLGFPRKDVATLAAMATDTLARPRNREVMFSATGMPVTAHSINRGTVLTEKSHETLLRLGYEVGSPWTDDSLGYHLIHPPKQDQEVA